MRVQDRIKAFRIAKGFTQDDVARKIGTTKQTIYKYESGIVTNIPLENIEAMAKMFEVEPWEIMGWEKPATASDSELLSDPLNKEILSLTANLTQEEKRMFRAQLLGILDNR